MSENQKKVKPTDPNFEECVLRWFEECDTDGSDQDGDPESNITIENAITSDHETASELSGDDSDDQDEMQVTESEDDRDPSHSNKKYFYGKNRYKWAATEPTRNVRTPAHNILKLPGNKNALPEIVPLDAWRQIFSQDILDIVVHYTNLKIQEFRNKPGNQNRTEYKETNSIEINGLLGLLLLTAAFKSNNEAIKSIFSTDGTGREIFRLVTSAKRFAVLLACLRFDTHEERIVRVKTDPAAAISHIFEKFNQNSQSAYALGANVTVDEMLVGFRGRCKFKMYLPSKPVKYGLKVQCLVDARTHYIYNTYIYCGKGTDSLKDLTEEEKRFAIPTQAVLRLSKPLFGSNRNITGDNWYSSIELTDYLLQNKLTYVGTVKKNKREIPKEFLPSKTRQVGSTLYGFTSNKTLISRVPKKNKAVILISSMHHCKQDDNGLPEINAFYNNTKSGVDAVDEKTTKYSCSRRTQRWPMTLFYRIVDMSSVNAYIIHQSCANADKLDRLDFLKLLAKQLYEPLLRERSQNAHLPRELKAGIVRILKMALETPADDQDVLPRNQRNYYIGLTIWRPLVAAPVFGVLYGESGVSNPPAYGLSEELGYVLYSALGSFYIPSCIMVFVYIRIYYAAKARARRGIRKPPRRPVDAQTSFTNSPRGPSTKNGHSTVEASASVDRNSNTSPRDGERQIATIEAPPPAAPIPIPVVTCDLASDISTSDNADQTESQEQKDTLQVYATTTVPIRTNTLSVCQFRGSTLSVNGELQQQAAALARSRQPSMGIDTDMVSEFDPSSSDSGVVAQCTTVKPLKLRLCKPIFGRAKHTKNRRTEDKKSPKSGERNGAENKPVVEHVVPRVQKPRDPEREKRRIARKKEKRATLILGLIMGSFIACWLPFFFMYILRLAYTIPPIAFSTAFWLGYMNSALNPVIYTIFNKDFRRAFRRILFK